MSDLDSTLTRLAAMREQAMARYLVRRREEEKDEDYDAESDFDGGFWLALEEAEVGWECGWRIRPDEATEWASIACGPTPSAAAQALLTLMET